MKFFELAKKLSQKSDYRHKLGAVVTKKNRVLGIGWNKPFKTNPNSNNLFRTTHAELDAILSSNRDDLKGSTIYVYRQFSNGNPAPAKPCIYCQELIRLAGIKKVYYSAENNYMEYTV